MLGSSIYHIGVQTSNWGKNMELTVLSQAMYHARELAMTRMEAEAHALGADGIVGVRLHVKAQEWGSGISEFIAVGTAVLSEKGGQWKDNRGRPFTSDLTGQDFWTLLQAGYAPVGLVLGTCVYHVAHRKFGQMLSNLGQNAEVPQFTQALYDARELAMGRMQAEAHALGAEGIVGVALTEHNHVWGQHAMEFYAVGTAVRPISDDARRPATADGRHPRPLTRRLTTAAGHDQAQVGDQTVEAVCSRSDGSPRSTADGWIVASAWVRDGATPALSESWTLKIPSE